MKNMLRFSLLLFVWLAWARLASTQTLSPDLPTWWAKYQGLLATNLLMEEAFTATIKSAN